jgi:hypothetical protein
MSFQTNLLETTAALRSRASDLAATGSAAARARANTAVKSAQRFKGAFDVLAGAGREITQIARRHAARFVRENATMAGDARTDVSTLARRTFSALTVKRATPRSKDRKTPAGKRAKAKAA